MSFVCIHHHALAVRTAPFKFMRDRLPAEAHAAWLHSPSASSAGWPSSPVDWMAAMSRSGLPRAEAYALTLALNQLRKPLREAASGMVVQTTLADGHVCSMRSRL